MKKVKGCGNTRGISLITLVITIIVIIILAGAIILTIANNNPINAANEAIFKGDLDTFRSELLLYNTQMYASTGGTYNQGALQAGTDTIGDIIKNLHNNRKYEGKLLIENGNLIFICTGTQEDEWAEDIEITVKCIEPEVSISAPEPTVVNSANDVKYIVTAVSNYPITNVVESNIKAYRVKTDPESQDTELNNVLSFNYTDDTSEDGKYLKLIEVTVETNTFIDGNYYIKVLPNTVVTQVSGKEAKNNKEAVSSTFEVNNVAPVAPLIEINPTGWTNQNVTVTITYYEGSVDKKYSLDNRVTWLDYTGPFIVTNNLIVIAKATNTLGTESIHSSFEISNIERIAPQISLTNNLITSTTLRVVASATDTGGSGIDATSYQYSKDNGATWTSATTATIYTFTGLSTATSYQCRVKVKDKAGNEGISTTLSLTTYAYEKSNPPVTACGGSPLTVNSTINGSLPSYNNPVIPAGFVPVNTNDANWGSLQWNNGLVIQDTECNQYVWVPVDGSSVTFARNFTYPSSYSATASNTIEAALPGGINQSTQITKYKGFYVSRYEVTFGGGSKKGQEIGWYAYFSSAQSTAEYFGSDYDTSKVVTHLITGTQWDTVMKWLNNSGKSVTDSRSWGNYYDSISPANVESEFYSFAGYSEYWKAKNIYDLAGGYVEFTNETYNGNGVLRGGRVSSGSIPHCYSPASYRGYYREGYDTGNINSIRVVLNIF